MIIDKEVKYEKDVADVCVLVVALVDAIKNKKDYSEVIAALIPAIDSIGTIPASWESDKAAVIGTFSYEMSKLIDVLVK